MRPEQDYIIDAKLRTYKSDFNVGARQSFLLISTKTGKLFFEKAEEAVPRTLFREVLGRIGRLRFLAIPARPG